MRSDIDTFLGRVGQPEFDYVEFNTPTDVEIAARFPLIAHLVKRFMSAPVPERAT